MKRGREVEWLNQTRPQMQTVLIHKLKEQRTSDANSTMAQYSIKQCLEV